MILAYHKINCTGNDPLTVQTEMFLRQLDYLEDRGFNFISPEYANTSKDNKILLTFDDGYNDNYEVIYPLLKAKGIPGIFFVTYDFIGKPGRLSLGQLKVLSGTGFTIGSHTLSHPHLTTLDIDDARKEIVESRHRLGELLKREIEYFSYPYGEWNCGILRLVKEAGYKAAFFTSSRHIKKGPFALKRLGIYHHTNLPLFKFKLAIPSF